MARTPNLGFLTIQHESAGWIGAVLVTNHWGRPLEFHVTNPVQPTRIQQILYGPTWKAYLCSEVLAKALLDKVTISLDLVITDTAEVLNAGEQLPVPVVFLDTNLNSESAPEGVSLLDAESWKLVLPHVQQHHDQLVRDVLTQLQGLDLAEPFDRLREAIRESRRLGVFSRAA